MTVFSLFLKSSTTSEQIENLVHFKGRDASGSFGILANAFRLITSLDYGIATLKKQDGSFEYLALPGGVLYFINNELKIITTTYIHSTHYNEISEALEKTIQQREESIREIKHSLYRLDDEIFRRLSEWKH